MSRAFGDDEVRPRTIHAGTPGRVPGPTLRDAGVRRRGLTVLLAATFLTWGGFFMAIPLIAVHYVDGLGWAAASVGAVLGLRQFLQQGSTAISGALADRLGAKPLICAGLLLRVAAFGCLALADSYPLLLLSAVLTALGGGLFESPMQATIAALTDEADRTRYFARQSVVSGLGTALGTQVGALLVDLDFALVALAAAASFLLVFLVVALLFPAVRVAAPAPTLTHGLGLALRDRPFVTFRALLLGYYFLWMQLYITLPLAARGVGGSASTVGWVYALNSGLAILLGYPLPRLAERWLRPRSILALGVATMALGLGGIGFVPGVAGLLGCVALVSAGSLLATPSQQAVTASLANPAALGSYLGLGSLSVAIGGGLGQATGGLLYDLGQRWGFPALPWLAFGAIGLATTAGLVASSRRADTAPDEDTDRVGRRGQPHLPGADRGGNPGLSGPTGDA